MRALSMGVHTVNFKDATDRLFDRIDHAALARSLNISVASIRQARLAPSAKSHREPPHGWEVAVIRLAEKQALKFRRVAEQMRKQSD
jgi:hypothetical protein